MNSAANTNATETQITTVTGKLVRIKNLENHGVVECGHNATILPGDSIVIWGVDTNRVKGPTPYDRTFSIGDSAEYASYNTSFFGKIVGISATRVRIENHFGKVSSLKIGDFARRNRHFVLSEVEASNRAHMA